MADPVSRPPVAAPEGAPQADASQTSAEQQPKPLTADDVRAIARAEALRTSQSLTDKAEARIKAHLTTLQASGVTVTPDQESKLRSTVAAQVMVEESSAGGQTTPPSPTPAGELDPSVALSLEAMTAEGVQIVDGDPELPALLAVMKKPGVKQYEIMKATQAAIEAKRGRTSQAVASANLRVPAGSGAQAPRVAENSDELWRDAHKPG